MIEKRICCDADDVLIKTTLALNEFHNTKYGKSLTLSDYYTFDFTKVFNISEHDFRRDEREFYHTDLYLNVEPLEGAFQAIDYLSETCDILVMTGRGTDVAHHLPVTLEKLFAEHHFHSIHHLGEPFNSRLSVPKWKRCVEEGIPLIIDDYDKTIVHAAQNGIHGILVTAPWNKYIYDLPKIVDRARNWEEALEIIQKKEKIIWPD
jgi:uncharacterized HAD superfamily protein